MKYLLFFLLLPSLVAVGQTNSTQTPAVEWKKLQRHNYSIQYPTTWQMDTTGMMQTDFFVFAPMESGKDKFRENINLVIQDVPANDLEKFTQTSQTQIKTMLTHAAIIESRRVKTPKGEYQKMVFSGDQGVFHLKFQQFYLIQNNKAYVLTYTAEQTKFDLYRSMAEKTLQSFTLQ